MSCFDFAYFFFFECDHVIKFGFEFMYLIHFFRVVLFQFTILLFFELFETFKFGVKFVMPGVEDGCLEEQGTAAHGETGDGKPSIKKGH